MLTELSTVCVCVSRMGSLASYSQILHHYFPLWGVMMSSSVWTASEQICVEFFVLLRNFHLCCLFMWYFLIGTSDHVHPVGAPLHGVAYVLVTHLRSMLMSDASCIVVVCSSCGGTRIWTPHTHTNANAANKDDSARIKVMNKTKKSFLSSVADFLCLACPHTSPWVSWRAIHARQAPTGYHTRDITWGQTASVWMEDLLRLSSLICFVVLRVAFECESFPF